jgi:hypothetical protein
MHDGVLLSKDGITELNDKGNSWLQRRIEEVKKIANSQHINSEKQFHIERTEKYTKE